MICDTPRILVAGTGSGCGKTTVSMALLAALKSGRNLRAFKCGPDYIDPMFHERVLHVPCRNLDSYLLSTDTVRYLFAENSRGADLALIEGVMGYFDGLENGDTGSTHEIAKILEAPVILVLNCRGRSRSAAAELLGFRTFADDGLIAGVIFNEASPGVADALAGLARQAGVTPLGYMPRMKASLASRHLGLVTPDESADLQEQIEELGRMAEATLDLEGIVRLARGAAPLAVAQPALPAGAGDLAADFVAQRAPGRENVTIGVARDAAFCFLYEDNLRLLERLGARLVFFSPLTDTRLPEGISGLYLCGGYPELYARQLSTNRAMLACVRKAAACGMPAFAECGGFLYLHDSLADPEGEVYQMAGVIPAAAHFTQKLQHFGYVSLQAGKDTLLLPKGGCVRAHEFHRTVSGAKQDAFTVRKGDRQWGGYIAEGNLLAGYPHIHFWSDPRMAARFIGRCREWAARLPGKDFHDERN